MANDDWKQVDIDTLPHVIQGMYVAMKEKYREYKVLKDKFELEMQEAFKDNLPVGAELKFGYNFGKLSIAVGPKREQKAKKQDTGGSLADWLIDQSSGGHAV